MSVPPIVNRQIRVGVSKYVVNILTPTIRSRDTVYSACSVCCMAVYTGNNADLAAWFNIGHVQYFGNHTRWEENIYRKPQRSSSRPDFVPKYLENSKHDKKCWVYIIQQHINQSNIHFYRASTMPVSLNRKNSASCQYLGLQHKNVFNCCLKQSRRSHSGTSPF